MSYIVHNMARTTQNPQAETFTFRLDPALKVALSRSAKEENRQPAELVRDLVRRHLAAKAQAEFEREARRQSVLVAGGAGEAEVLAELDQMLVADDFGAAWKP